MNKVVPELLKSSPRARHGVHSARLITDPPASAFATSGANFPAAQPITIRLRHTDALTAARQMTQFSRRTSVAVTTAGQTTRGDTKAKNACILSMASPLRAGGGFLDGAASQEEFLCMRTTLYPSLWNDFYCLPEVGGILTSDVLVHRDSSPQAVELPKRDRFYVDVISSAMFRFPETTAVTRDEAEDGVEPGCSCGVSYCDRDRELVTRKMRAVMRMAQAQGAECLVLGAWGCGSYGHPVKEVAKIWKRVLLGSARRKENWAGIREVVFAINDRAMLMDFEKCFADVSTHDCLPSPPPEPVDAKFDGAKSPTSELINELVCKIQETELQLDQTSNSRSKARLRDIIAGLNRQLANLGAEDDEDDMTAAHVSAEVDVGDAYDATMSGIPASDGEENSYYNFDSEDEASSGSVSPSAGDFYEFRAPDPPHANRSPYTQSRPGGSRRVSTSRFSSYEYVDIVASGRQDQQFNQESGWFNGSINGLSALLSKAARAPGSPVLGPESSEIEGIEGMGLGEYVRRYLEAEN